MKLNRSILLLVAVVPGFFVAIACGILFVSDLNVYLAIPSQAEPATPAFATPDSGPASALSTILGHGVKTLLRINLFESGAGVVLGLILATVGINGLSQLSAKINTVAREPEQTNEP